MLVSAFPTLGGMVGRNGHVGMNKNGMKIVDTILVDVCILGSSIISPTEENPA
jgi:hypothetical protein